MAKDRSFASKVSKAHGDTGANHCPKCGEIVTPVRLVTSEKKQSSGAWRFSERLVKVCKCNEKEVYG